MTRETRLDKADRLIREGKVELLSVHDAYQWEALVTGDSGDTYIVGRNPESRWCECPFGAERGCSHFLAADAAATAYLIPKGASA